MTENLDNVRQDGVDETKAGNNNEGASKDDRISLYDPEKDAEITDQQLEIRGHVETFKDLGIGNDAIEKFLKQTKNLPLEEVRVLSLGLMLNKDEINEFIKTKKSGNQNEEDLEAFSKKITSNVGEDTLNKMALAVLSSGINWVKKGVKESDLTLLIDAIIMGADYNSVSSMKNSYEADGVEQITTNKFFKKFAQKPSKSLEKMLEIEQEISQKLNWKTDILSQAKDGNDQIKKTALKDYFVAMYKTIAKNSGAENLLWKRVAPLIAGNVFGEKAVLDPELLKELEAISKDENRANQRFDL